MTDRYEKIRKALEMGPTPGPWSVRYDYVVQAELPEENRLIPIVQPYGLKEDGSDLFANAAYVAACDPVTIRELLAERDQYLATVERLKSMTAVTMGVGSGDGKLFVHGDYESIKAAQAIVLERDALLAEMKVWKASFEQAAAGHATYSERADKLQAEVKELREALKDIRNCSSMNAAMNPSPYELTALLGDIHQIADAALAQETKA